jgi:hypothetical protein
LSQTRTETAKVQSLFKRQTLQETIKDDAKHEQDEAPIDRE